MAVLPDRIRALQASEYKGGLIVYVMGRDFRVEHNWALLYAQELALKHKVPLCVLVHFGKNFITTNERQHTFFTEGLQEISGTLENLGIPFFITYGAWQKEVKEFVRTHAIGAIVTDFSPLREMRWWWDEVAHNMRVPIYEVDAHNIVPCWKASDKEEYSAATFRRKMQKILPEYMGKFPAVKQHPYAWGSDAVACWPRGTDHNGCALIDWDGVRQFRTYESDVPPVSSVQGGSAAAKRIFEQFLEQRLAHYGDRRNDPNAGVLSELSPYIRFGFISAQYIADRVSKVRGNEQSKKSFLEELIIRRELAENFCYYQEQYDSLKGARKWARQTLKKHAKNKRPYIYTLSEFEHSETHDELWNAAQRSLVQEGRMHAYMRMYWAKKILEWTTSPDEAIEIAIILNDRYAFDGRDPNSYVGIMWSIAGIHDRAWAERLIYGKIRYMNDAGCRRKFDVDAYIQKYS